MARSSLNLSGRKKYSLNISGKRIVLPEAVADVLLANQTLVNILGQEATILSGDMLSSILANVPVTGLQSSINTIDLLNALQAQVAVAGQFVSLAETEAILGNVANIAAGGLEVTLIARELLSGLLASVGTTSFQASIVEVTQGPLATDLISYWELEEASGTRVDSHGSMDWSPVGTPGNATGIQGNGIQLDRGNPYYLDRELSASDDLQMGTRDMAVQVWVKPLGDPLESQWHDLLNMGANSNTDPGYLTGFRNDGRLFAWFGDGTTRPSADLTDVITPNNWSHIIQNIKRDSNMELSHNDGTPATVSISASEAVDIQTVEKPALGGGFVDTPNAVVDETAVWGRSLTAAEITGLNNSGSGLSYDDTIAWTPP